MNRMYNEALNPNINSMNNIIHAQQIDESEYIKPVGNICALKAEDIGHVDIDKVNKMFRGHHITQYYIKF